MTVHSASTAERLFAKICDLRALVKFAKKDAYSINFAKRLK